MGNNGSSSRNEQTASNRSNGLPIPDANRGWSQSFPRELAKHRSQANGAAAVAAARKVLPEPPNQRLRATDNGSIIQNGGTISGRRVSTYASSRDLSKRDRFSDEPFRCRSTSASRIPEPRSTRIERACCRYQADAIRRRSDAATADLKRFGSEPDLRYSAESPESRSNAGYPIAGEEDRPSNRRRLDRDYKDRVESRYRARKKYKAPAPPTVLLDLGNDSISTSISTSMSTSMLAGPSDLEAPYGRERDVQPPPRKSRLFKTRAETKKARVGWQLSGYDGQRRPLRVEPGHQHRCRTDDDSARAHNDLANGRTEHQRPSADRYDGKNTLRRSVSSPEFQAELIQVARRVRDKLACSSSTGTAGHPDAIRGEARSLDRRYESPSDRVPDRLFETIRERSEAPGHSRPEVETETENENEDANQSSKARHRRTDERSNEETDDRFPRGANSDEKTTNSLNLESSNVDQGSIDRVVGRRQSDPDHARSDRIASDGSLPIRAAKESVDNRSWVPGRLEQRLGDKENLDPGRWNGAVDPVDSTDDIRDPALAEERREYQQPNVSATRHVPKTFYFGMNELLVSSSESRRRLDQPKLEKREKREKKEKRERREKREKRSEFRDEENGRSSMETAEDTDDTSGRNVAEDISLQLRPTLPKKQLEIPRFSPSAAWRLLSTMETPGPSMSTASEEMPIMFEERIERLSRPPPPPPPPPPLLALGPRSSHDKSGDSGISGDAGAGNEDSLDVSTINRVKTSATRPTWTPQQDLGEESSSDAGVDSPSPLPVPFKYPPRARVFSLSLPREEPRYASQFVVPETKAREQLSTFNSLKKLKRSVSGAFGIGAHELRRKHSHDVLDDNWFLSTSAPTSLQHGQSVETTTRFTSSCWKSIAVRERGHGNSCEKRLVGRNYHDTEFDGDGDGDADDDDDENDDDDDDDEEEEEEVDDEDDDEDTDEQKDRETEKQKNKENEEKMKEFVDDFPVALKPPSFSYLSPGGHVMYLPETNDGITKYPAHNRSDAEIGIVEYEETKEEDKRVLTGNRGTRERYVSSKRRSRTVETVDNSAGDSKQKRETLPNSWTRNGESSFALKQVKQVKEEKDVKEAKETKDTKETKPQGKSGSKSRRFTFQSTVRQIERRRLAEKLSREAEAKERQRKGELEAMRRVEEEFQRKRAKEKANIRQQLRLFKEMEENFNNLDSAEWDDSQARRAEPDGATSSTASSPTWQPAENCKTTPRKSLERSNEFHRKRDSGSGSGSESKQRRAEANGYRPNYYDWAPETASHLDTKQTTVHPKVVCDIPKSSPAFVELNMQPSKLATASDSTLRSDNYRKDFAHGAMIAKSSFASSDSELSQPNTRPQSREAGVQTKAHRTRSTSRERCEDAATSEEEQSMEPAKRPRNPAYDFTLSGLRPFTRRRTYRPISFDPRPSTFVPS